MRANAVASKVSTWLGHDEVLERVVGMTRLRLSERCGGNWLVQASRPWIELRHPSIVALYEAHHLGRRLLWVSEAAAGPSLAEWCQERGRPDPSTLRDMLAGLFLALDYAHVRGIAHGSLSEDALLVVGSDQLRLLRWAPEQLAVLSEDWSQGPIPSFMLYQAPEQLRGGSADATSDIWALGVLLFHLVTGEFPFETSDLGWLCAQIFSVAPRELDLPEGYPSGLPRVVARCLSKEPQSRPQSVREIWESLYPQISLPFLDGQRRARLLNKAASGGMESLGPLCKLWRSDGHDAALAHNIGVTYMDLDMPLEATRWLWQAVALGPERPAIRQSLAALCSRLGESEEAAEQALRGQLLGRLSTGWLELALQEARELRVYPVEQPSGAFDLTPSEGWRGGENRPCPDSEEPPTTIAEQDATLPFSIRPGGSDQRALSSTLGVLEFEEGQDRVTAFTFEVAAAAVESWFLQSNSRWAGLVHPAILPLYAIRRRDRVVTVLTAPLPKTSLRAKIARAGYAPALSPEGFRAVVLAVGSALALAHHRRVVHGALSADAVWLDDREEQVTPRLLRFSPDFLAALGGSVPLATELELLTFRSPQQWMGETSAACDIYAFGVLLYQVTTGRLPFPARSHSELHQQAVSLEPQALGPLPEGFPSALPLLIADCLRKWPDERPKSIEAVVKGLYPDAVFDPIDRARQRRLHGLAVERLLAGEGEDAAGVLNLLLAEVDPQDAEAYNNLGCLLAQRGDDWAEVVEAFRQGYKLAAPGRMAAGLNLAWALLRDGRSEEALPLARQTVRQHPDCAEAHALVAACCSGSEAIAALYRAVQLEPRRAAYRWALAEVNREMGRTEFVAKHKNVARTLGDPVELLPLLMLDWATEEWEGARTAPDLRTPPGEGEGGSGRRGDPGGRGGPDGGSGVPRRQPPVAPSASEAKSWPSAEDW